MPRSRYRVQCDPCPHFLTATVNYWLPLFTRPETVNIISAIISAGSQAPAWEPSPGSSSFPSTPRHTGVQPCPEAATVSNAIHAYTS
jgi:hypothetical protein